MLISLDKTFKVLAFDWKKGMTSVHELMIGGMIDRNDGELLLG